MIQYIIRQQVKTAYKSRLEDIYDSGIERLAWDEYFRLKDNYPSEYFELIKKIYSEECLAFTPKIEEGDE